MNSHSTQYEVEDFLGSEVELNHQNVMNHQTVPGNEFLRQKIPQNLIAKEADIVWGQDYHQTVPGNEFFGQKIPQNLIAKEEDIVWGQDYHSLMTEVWDEKMSQQQLK